MTDSSDAPFSLAPSGASAGSAFSVAAAALEPATGSSSKSSKFITGAGTGSGALPVALDCVVGERIWFVVDEAARRAEVSSSPASYSSKSVLLGVLSRNPLLLPPPEYSIPDVGDHPVKKRPRTHLDRTRSR
jgi:hypothetical protein